MQPKGSRGMTQKLLARFNAAEALQSLNTATNLLDKSEEISGAEYNRKKIGVVIDELGTNIKNLKTLYSQANTSLQEQEIFIYKTSKVIREFDSLDPDLDTHAIETECLEKVARLQEVRDDVNASIESLEKIHADLSAQGEEDFTAIHDALTTSKENTAKYKINFQALLKAVTSFSIDRLAKVEMREAKKAQLDDMINKMSNMNLPGEQTTTPVESNIIAAKKIRRKFAPFARKKALRTSIENNEPYIDDVYLDKPYTEFLTAIGEIHGRIEEEMDSNSIGNAIKKLKAIQAEATKTFGKIGREIKKLSRQDKDYNSNLFQENMGSQIDEITDDINFIKKAYEAKREALTTSSAPKMT